MSSAQTRKTVGKAAGIKEPAVVPVFLSDVPNLVLCAGVGVAPPVSEGIGGLSGFLQVGHAGAAANAWFDYRVSAQDRW